MFSSFFTGCNYWASHAGTNMWSDWNETVVEQDFKALRDAKLTVLRVFPLWSDFQPIVQHRAYAGQLREVRLREEPLPDTEAGRAGVDAVMLERFERLCDLAAHYDLKLIVGLLTGWMSGRLHVPPALDGLNVLTDPFAIQWELRFVRCMVRRFKDHPAIAAWDLGNECNCMGTVDTPQQAYVWTAAISDAIRACDPFHPLVSGMHGLRPEGNWQPRSHAENVDVLTTHPYPIFTPYCDTDPLNEMKTSLHAVSETLFMRGLSGKPAFAEEVGTLGPMMASEEIAADYINTCLYSLYAHDCRGFLWWCANEQSHLTHTPYDWDCVERELGLFRRDGSPKPVLHTIRTFTENISRTGTLPPRLTDAVCVLTRGQDTWRAAFGSFLLAKQAGLDIEYAWGEDALPDSPVYLLPALSGGASLPGHVWKELQLKVLAGATLYLSLDDALLSPFDELTGLRVQTRSRASTLLTATLEATRETFTLPVSCHLRMHAVSAQVLAAEKDGNPVFTVHHYGRGRVFLLTAPIENCAAGTPGIISGEHTVPLYRFYQALGVRNPRKVVLSSDPTVCVTEHMLDETTHRLVIINYRPCEKKCSFRLPGSWHFGSVAGSNNGVVCKTSADGFSVTMPRNSALIIDISQ